MIDDRFALSPVSARSAPLTEADYDAICEAFRETARGRWFLDEFARRNRHADTLQVLEAIERLENVARQSTPAAAPAKTTTATTAANALPEDFPRRLGELLVLIEAASDNAGAKALSNIAEALQHLAWNIREADGDWTMAEALEQLAGSATAVSREMAQAAPLTNAMALARQLMAEIEPPELADAAAHESGDAPPAARREVQVFVTDVEDLVWETPAESTMREAAMAELAITLPPDMVLVTGEALEWTDGEAALELDDAEQAAAPPAIVEQQAGAAAVVLPLRPAVVAADDLISEDSMLTVDALTDGALADDAMTENARPADAPAAAPRGKADPFAAVMALSRSERIALFS